MIDKSLPSLNWELCLKTLISSTEWKTKEGLKNLHRILTFLHSNLRVKEHFKTLLIPMVRIMLMPSKKSLNPILPWQKSNLTLSNLLLEIKNKIWFWYRLKRKNSSKKLVKNKKFKSQKISFLCMITQG